MNPPDLKSLQQGDEVAWDAAFGWLWPTVFAVAQLKLAPFLPDEVEDVAIESLEELVLGKHHGKSFQETFPIVKDLPSTLNRVKSFVTEQTRP